MASTMSSRVELTKTNCDSESDRKHEGEYNEIVLATSLMDDTKPRYTTKEDEEKGQSIENRRCHQRLCSTR